MSTPEPGRRSAGVIAGVIGAAALIGGAVLIATHKSAPVTITPSPGASPGQVTGVTITPTGPTSAVVSWQPPTSNSSTPLTYLGQHTDQNGNAVTTAMGSSPAQFTTGNTTFPLDGLTPGQSLHLTIQACLTGSDGFMSTTCGTPSAVASVTMPGPTVPQVTGVQLTPTGPTTLTIAWSPVSVPAGAQSVSYTVTHLDSAGAVSSEPMGNSPSTVSGITGTSLSLTGLTPGADFHCDVQACATY